MILQLLIPVLMLFYPPQQRVEFIQHQGGMSDSLSVYVFLHDECVISQYFTPQLAKLYSTYKDKRVGFTGYFPNNNSTPEDMVSFGDEFGLEFPLLEDYDKKWTRTFGITITPEVAVWDHRRQDLVYRGRIDDSFVRVGKRKLHIQHHDLKDIIDAWIANEELTFTSTRAIGCYISFERPVGQ